ncbi:uncharacterized protein F4812DRAFT_197945 [Daldinia caldariorum]|uniref:uncharacterized protein n=1 Tax=Daldinia caldariorum TaxID=326644 RepID=UPI002007202D|nr:uncharacterized protein F4812DRAFT_197945 [Daldinia caldariorum]KAI1471891.1 hypothetical protein F4812DRAFT_197945 [Daldinia caldariorum]
MPKNGTTWSFEVYRDVSRAVWEVAKLTPEQKEQIAEKLREMGHGMTANGMRQHFQKMIRDEKVVCQGAASPDASPDANQPNTKKKATAAPARRGRGAGTKRKTKIPVDYDEDDEEQKTPKKRSKNQSISMKFEDDDMPSPSQDDKDSGESTAQLEKQEPMTFLPWFLFGCLYSRR